MPRGVPAQLNTELREYLARPIVFQRGIYSQSSPGIISQGSINTTNMLTYFPHLDRIKGSFGFRATIVIRIELQATPYHCGRLRLVWEPELENNLAFTYDRAAYLTTMSMLPGVELCVNDATSVVMRVPYVHSDDYWWYSNSVVPGKTSTVSYIGTWSLWAMHPVSTPAGATNPNYSIWTSLEDVELIASAAPDSDVSFVVPTPGVVMSTLSALSPLPPSELRASFTRTVVTPQSGGGDPAAAETGSPDKPISTTLMAASRVLTYAGSAIPLISSYTGVASWAMRVASNVAAAFGWSKPLVTSAVTRVMPTTNNYQFNCDGHDASWNLGLFSDNHVQPLPGFAGSDIDEMALDYISSVPAVISTTSFATTNVVGDLLYISAINPQALWFAKNANLVQSTAVTAGVTSFLASPLFFLSNCFRYWRGDITFRFKISKTLFHSGRLLISHHASYSTTAGNKALPVPNYSKPFNFKSVLWDLKDSSEIEFTVPYTHVRPYALVSEILGSLCVTVEQPLLAPTTVAPSLFMSVEVYSKNFSYAYPTTPFFLPSPLRPSSVTPQSGPIADRTVQGETVQSLKQLGSLAGVGATQGPNSSAVLSSLCVYTPSTYDNPTIPNNTIRPNAIFQNLINSLYAYCRGSTRVFVQTTGLTNTRISLQYVSPTTYPQTSYTPFIYENTNSPARAIMPFYNDQNRVRISSVSNTDMPYCLSRVYGVASGTTLAYLSGADDFQCGYFLGIPPLDRRQGAINNIDGWITAAYGAP